VTRDSTAGSTRIVELRIRPTLAGTLSLYLAPDSGDLSAPTIGGKPLPPRYSRGSRFPLQFVAPPDSGFTMKFAMPAGSHMVLGMMSRVNGLPAVSGLTAPQRPAGIIPIHYPDITLVYKRLRI